MAVRIYNLFPFIEENILGQAEQNDSDDDSNDKTNIKTAQNAKKNREKVLRQTKLIPKLVFRIETFNKFVLLLSKKTKKDLTYLLHIGTVRDFRIKEPALIEAIKNACDGRADVAGSEFGDLADLDVQEDENEALFLRPTESSELVGAAASLGPEESQLNEQESNTETSDVGDENQALKNLALLNERSKRKSRKKRSSTEDDPGAARGDDAGAGKKRKVTKKKAESPKINKRALETINEIAAVKVTTSKTLGPIRRTSRGSKKS